MTRPAIALVLPLLLLPCAARAEIIEPQREYRACLSLAQSKPDEGWEEAIAWQSLGGGEPARHCAALALIGQGKYEEGAKRLEALAQQSRREESLRAEMLAQAAQAWMLATQPERALADLDTALGLVPGQPDLILDKAVLLASQGHHAEVVGLLTGLLKAQPNRVEALTLRASAQRLLDHSAEAEKDITRALELDPAYPDALLERGMIRRGGGNEAGARADWMRAIEIAPEGPAADTARRNIELMDVKVK
ncbi:tetratricopeptide repeat protein [Magnetospirillum fulvum]|uniref:Tetratricopeptide repeat-containing protein n=1 Tax=Magnetospirillum fulvum TaxID=1082 RepID=A0A1H6GVT7_MAGFU|nr:tetratricopeptide repeat protein [Magnetospirillum fulvum]SEH25973.1 Tetratricopeptide repeat-containing protein [Magnetospirillum fulvum]